MEIKIAWGIVCLASAAMIALLAAHAAHDLLGISLRTIRSDALCSAAVAGGLLIAALVGSGRGTRR